MEENQQLNVNKIIKKFYKYIENNNNLLNKKSFHLIF